jgi:hypothetical protein
MKKILFFSLMMVCLFSFGKCNKKKKCCNKDTVAATRISAGEVWMRFDETKCENPWNFNWFAKPTAEQLLSAVKSDLLGKGIQILEIRSSTDKGLISCEACTCPNGTHYFVRVNKSESEKLKALKFYEVKEIPKIESIDTSK